MNKNTEKTAGVFTWGVLTLIVAIALFLTNGLRMDGFFGIYACASYLIFVALIRHNSQFTAVFALFVGYYFLLALADTLPYVLLPCVYMTLLTLYNLVLSTWRSWRVTRFVGLFMVLYTGFALCGDALLSVVDETEKVELWGAAAFGASVMILFLAHLTIPVFGAWFLKDNIRKADIVLLSCSAFGCFLLECYWVSPIYFIVPAVFAVCCICMAFIMEWKKRRGTQEIDSLRNLFFILSVTFTALIGLFEAIESEALDGSFYLITVGWPIFTAGLAIYGIFKNSRRFIIAAEVMGVCCIFSFFVGNVWWIRDWIYDNVYYYIFDWFLVGSFNVSDIDLYALPQYISTILAWVVVAFATLRIKPQRKSVDVGLNIFRGIGIVNLWTVLVFAFDAMPWSQNLFFDDQDWWFVWLIDYYDDFTFTYIVIATFTLGLALAYFIPKIRRTYNYGFHIASVVLGIASIILLLAYNTTDPFNIDGWLVTYKYVFPNRYEPVYGFTIGGNVAMALYIVANILAVCFVYDSSRYITRFPLAWRHLLAVGVAVLLVVQNLISISVL